MLAEGGKRAAMTTHVLNYLASSRNTVALDGGTDARLPVN